MTKKQLIQAAILNISIVIVDIVLLSKGFLHLLSQENVLWKAVGIAVIVMSVLFFFYGNYSIFIRPRPARLYKSEELKDPDDYLEALKSCPNQRVFRDEIEKEVKQIERMEKKTAMLMTILLQYFTEGEMAYSRFKNVIKGTEAIFWGNVKSIINRIIIFDGEEYKSNKDSEEAGKHHIEYIRQVLGQNDVLLKKMDALILEVARLDDMKETSIEELPAIQEINQLIEETKYYRA